MRDVIYLKVRQVSLKTITINMIDKIKKISIIHLRSKFTFKLSVTFSIRY